MIKKLFNNLLKPRKIYNKIFQKIQFYYKLKQFDQKKIWTNKIVILNPQI